MKKVEKEPDETQNERTDEGENTIVMSSQNTQASTYAFADNDFVDMSSQMVDMSSQMVDMSSEMVDMTSQLECHCDVGDYADDSPYEEEDCLEESIVTIPYMEENNDVTDQNKDSCDARTDEANDCDITVTSSDLASYKISENDGKYSGPEFDIYIEVCLIIYKLLFIIWYISLFCTVDILNK